MAFTFVRNMISNHSPVAPPKDVIEFACATETKKPGMPCKFDTDGKLAKLGHSDKNGAVIALEEGTHSPEESVRVQWIMPGNVYKVPLRKADGAKLDAGTAKNANVEVGSQLRVSANGLAADGETAPNAGHPLTVVKLEYDNDNRGDAMAWVMFAYSVVNSPA